MIRLIAAVDRRRGLAKHGYEPWYIPNDGEYFNEQTKLYGGRVLVGGVTFRNDLNSKPLAERTTYVVTREMQPNSGVEIVHNTTDWLKQQNGQDVWVIGGETIFSQVIAAGLADELYLTHIDADFNCDQFFPDYEKAFSPISHGDEQEQNGFHYRFARYCAKRG